MKSTRLFLTGFTSSIYATGIALIISLSAGCSSMKVTCKYDKNADFNSFKTYGFIQAINLPHLNSANKMLFINTVEQEMNNRGYRKSNSVTPDIWIDLSIDNIKSIKSAENNDHITGMNPYRVGAGRSTSSVRTHSQVKKILIIDIMDGKKNKPVWEGRAAFVIKEGPAETEKDSRISHAVIRIFKKYPVGISKAN